MQKAYVTALYDLIRKDKKVISCLSDSGTDYDELIAREFPDQVINFGISENTQLAAAAGMAAAGKIPFVYTTGAFIAYRSYEFLRDDICLQNRNVKLIGMGTGLAWSTLGATHHTTEDIALLYSMPNLTVITPASPAELIGAVKAAYELEGPVYIRMGMSGEKEIYGEEYEFALGDNVVVREGKDLTIFVTGSIISEVISAAEMLESNGISVRITNVHTLKPVNTEQILSVCNDHDRIVTVEEHNVNGGLGTIISDVIAGAGLPVRIRKIGLQDRFAIGFGNRSDVLKMNGLDASDIAETIAEYFRS